MDIRSNPGPEPSDTPVGYQRPGRGAQTSVFISYSRKDRIFTRRLFERLEAQGRAAWVDWESIPYSVDWWREIQDGIESADNVVCIVSPGWLTSEMCNKELAHAMACNKRIIPIIRLDLDELAIKAQWIDKPWEQQARANLDALKKINWIYGRKKSDGHEYKPGATPELELDQVDNDLDNFDKAVQDVIKTVETDDEHVRRHTRLLMRAREWEHFARNDSYLLRDLELDAAEAWLAISQGKQPEPTPLHRAYIEASQQYQARIIALEAERAARLESASRRARRFARLAAAVGVIAASLVIGATLFAANRITDAETRVTSANATLSPIPVTLTTVAELVTQGEARIISLNMASAAETILQVPQDQQPNRTLAAMLVIRGLKRAYTEQADAVLVKIAANAVKKRILNDAINYSPAFSTDGAYFAIGTFGGVVQVIDARSWDFLGGIDIGTRVYKTAFSPDNKTILTVSEDNAVRLWNAADGALLRVFQHKRGINGATFSADGRTLLTIASDNSIRLWDVFTGVERLTMSHTGRLLEATFSPDNTLILSRTDDNNAHLWNVTTGTEVHTFQHEDLVTSATFSPDGMAVLTGSADGTARLWDASNGAERYRLKHSGWDGRAIFSPDGKFILTHIDNSKISVWETATGNQVYDLQASTYIMDVVFSPDKRWLAVSIGDHTVRLLDASTGATVRTIYQPEVVKRLVFSPNAKVLMTIPDDQTVRLWDVQSGSELRGLKHTNNFPVAVFSSDSNWVVTTSSDGARLWEVHIGDFLADACSYVMRDFTDEERQRYSIPADEVACETSTGNRLLPPNPLLPSTTTPQPSVSPVPTLLIPTYTPTPG